MKKQWTMILSLLLVLLVAILAVLNVEPVPLNLGLTVIELPLILLIIGTLLIGSVVAVALSATKHYREKKELKHVKAELADVKAATSRKYEEQLKHLQSEVKELKAKIAEKDRVISNQKQAVKQSINRSDDSTETTSP